MNIRRVSGRVASTLASILLVLSAVIAPLATRAGAQVLPATAGAVGGFVAGTLVTTGIVVLQARLGRYVYGIEDLVRVRPELLPLVLGPVAGAVIGATSPETLRRAGTGALIGLAGGAALGMGIGQLIWSSPEGGWAGGIIGAATGTVVGAVLYATLGSRDRKDAPAAVASVSIKVPWGGR